MASPKYYLDMKELRKDFIDEPGLATGSEVLLFIPDFKKKRIVYTLPHRTERHC
jgi:hypothetical protein